jgi:Fis family transcriptional regulator
MTAKKKSRVREGSAARTGGAVSTKVNGSVRPNGRTLPLRSYAERVISDYFASLNGHSPAQVYDLVLHEVEEPLLRVVMNHAEGNQSKAAEILGINRATLRKKLRQHGLAAT